MTPTIPRSGVPGVTFKREIGRWVVKIKIEGQWEYKGAKKTLGEAVRFQRELTQ
jgi:hypothetical protein